MFGFEALSGSVEAAATVGLVLTEAIVLYVGYGALSGLAEPTILDVVGGD